MSTPVRMRAMRVRTVRAELGHCVEWTGPTDRGGYGRRWFEGRNRGAHRVAFFARHGRWPKQCRHKCDNPPCIRVDHLEDGTQQDNMDDMVARGRQRSLSGDAHPNTRITEAALASMRRMREAGCTYIHIANTYDVSWETVRTRLNGNRRKKK